MTKKPDAHLKFFVWYFIPSIILAVNIVSFFGYGRHFGFYYNSFKNIFISETNVIESIHSTTITPFMDTKIETDENLIYCATTSLVWNELNKLINETLEVENAPWYMKKINELNSKDLYIPKESYITLVGMDKDKIINKIKETMISQFDKSVNLNIALDEKELIAFSHMSNEINLGLTRFSEWSEFQCKNSWSRVKFLGLNKYCNKNYDDLRKRIKIFYYEAKDSYNAKFTIKILPQNSSNEIIISTIQKEDTLSDTYNKILQQIDTHEIFSNKSIYLRVPIVDFFIIQKYNDFKYIKSINKAFSGCRIDKMIQSVSFKLNEKDRFFELKEKISYDMKGTRLVAYRPFFICVKNINSKYPYFMIYIANDELLAKN